MAAEPSGMSHCPTCKPAPVDEIWREFILDAFDRAPGLSQDKFDAIVQQPPQP